MQREMLISIPDRYSQLLQAHIQALVPLTNRTSKTILEYKTYVHKP